MADLRQITDWRSPAALAPTYEKLLGAIGSEMFGSTVRDSVLSLTAGARRIYLFEATNRETSSLHYFSCESKLVDLFPAYQRWYLRQDPIGDAFSAAPESSNVALQRVRPPDIVSRSFRRRFFDDAGIVERISIVQRGVDTWRGINIARHSSNGYCSDDEIAALVGLAHLVLPMLSLNRSRALRPHLTTAHFESRLAERCGQLTSRERQVCARAAAGMNVQQTAHELGIAKSSVLTYRQRAYQRLCVRSALELRALVAP